MIETLENTPILIRHTRKRDIVRMLKRTLLPELRQTRLQVKELFIRPLKFNVKYLRSVDTRLLQILALAMGRNTNIQVYTEPQRRKLFRWCLYTLHLRKWTFEELRMLRAALGFPQPKRTKFKSAVHDEVHYLVKEIKKKMKT